MAAQIVGSMAGEKGTMILAMFCLSNDEKIPQMAEAYGGVGGADGDGRWGGQRSLHSSALGFAIVGRPGGLNRWRIVDLISTRGALEKISFVKCITKDICDALPEQISRRSSVHREQIDNIEHLGVGYCDQ